MQTRGRVIHAFVGAPLSHLPVVLRGAFTHAWVATYQVGFGPPLLKATSKLAREAKATATVHDKLDKYFEHCLFDERERLRLASRLRLQVLNRDKLVATDRIDEANNQALDLNFRLYSPRDAPDRTIESMRAAGIDPADYPEEIPPDLLTARFCVRIADPHNAPLVDRVAPDADADAFALELWVPDGLRDLWTKFGASMAERTGTRWFELRSGE